MLDATTVSSDELSFVESESLYSALWVTVAVFVNAPAVVGFTAIVIVCVAPATNLLVDDHALVHVTSTAVPVVGEQLQFAGDEPTVMPVSWNPLGSWSVIVDVPVVRSVVLLFWILTVYVDAVFCVIAPSLAVPTRLLVTFRSTPGTTLTVSALVLSVASPL